MKFIYETPEIQVLQLAIRDEIVTVSGLNGSEGSGDFEDQDW